MLWIRREEIVGGQIVVELRVICCEPAQCFRVLRDVLSVRCRTVLTSEHTILQYLFFAVNASVQALHELSLSVHAGFVFGSHREMSRRGELEWGPTRQSAPASRLTAASTAGTGSLLCASFHTIINYVASLKLHLSLTSPWLACLSICCYHHYHERAAVSEPLGSPHV